MSVSAEEFPVSFQAIPDGSTFLAPLDRFDHCDWQQMPRRVYRAIEKGSRSRSNHFF
jgi:hypothetical protein